MAFLKRNHKPEKVEKGGKKAAEFANTPYVRFLRVKGEMMSRQKIRGSGTKAELLCCS